MADQESQNSKTLQPLAVDAIEAAHLCGVSPNHWWKLHNSGRCPAPIRLGRRCLWRVAELREWMAAGCPPRDRWKAERWRKEKNAELKTINKKTAG